MDAGTTFLRADADKHLWIVLSDPTKDPDNVLLVNLTTLDEHKERACVLNRGDHPWIRHESCVNYGDSVVTSLAKLNAALVGGALRVQAPMAPEILRKVRNGALDSERMPLDNADILINQGLVEG
jgi:hypothetical protein